MAFHAYPPHWPPYFHGFALPVEVGQKRAFVDDVNQIKCKLFGWIRRQQHKHRRIRDCMKMYGLPLVGRCQMHCNTYQTSFPFSFLHIFLFFFFAHIDLHIDVGSVFR